MRLKHRGPDEVDAAMNDAVANRDWRSRRDGAEERLKRLAMIADRRLFNGLDLARAIKCELRFGAADAAQVRAPR
jgi:hypothetical protein